MAGAAPKSISATAAPNPPGPGAVHLWLPRARSVATVVASMACLRVSGTSLSSHLARPGLVGQAEAMPEEVLSAPLVITGEQAVVDGVVVIGDRTVDWAGAAPALPPEYRALPRTEYPGSTIMPGLIDSHVHLGFDGGPHPAARMRAETDEQQLVLMLRNARDLLGVGVTTVRDLGARAYLDVLCGMPSPTAWPGVPGWWWPARRSPSPAGTAGSWAAKPTVRTTCAASSAPITSRVQT